MALQINVQIKLLIKIYSSVPIYTNIKRFFAIAILLCVLLALCPKSLGGGGDLQMVLSSFYECSFSGDTETLPNAKEIV